METSILKQYFGYDQFKDGQEDVITSILDGNPTLAILPTGTGKSLCYQYPTYVWNDGLTLIVSPLLSLMYDQVTQIQKRGERAVVALTSELSQADKHMILQRLNHYRYLFVSPEMLLQSQVLEALKKQSIRLFAVDEAHCISQWGVDFRPEYQKLGEIAIQLQPDCLLALTATATAEVKEDIRRVLFLKETPVIIETSVNRPNIYYAAVETTEKDELLKQLITQYVGPGIIYFTSKKLANRITLFLQNECGVKVAAYHADMDVQERRSIQQQFLHDKIEILCATTAFGMGVNKSNIRYVIHYQLSSSIEAFMQESGRAGRDGKPALSLVLYQSGDENVHRLFLEETLEEFEALRHLLSHSLIDVKSLTTLQQYWWAQQENNANFIEEMEQILLNNYRSKFQQLRAIVQYVHHRGCKREFLLHYFDTTIENKNQTFCCDEYAIDLEEILNKRQVKHKPEKANWETLLEKLFALPLKDEESE